MSFCLKYILKIEVIYIKKSEIFVFVGLLMIITMLFAPWTGTYEKSYVMDGVQRYNLFPGISGIKTEYGVPFLVASFIILITMIFNDLKIKVNMIRFFSVFFMAILNIIVIIVFSTTDLNFYPLYFLEPVGLILIFIGCIIDIKNHE